MPDIGVEKTDRVALVEIRRPPNNFFDVALIKEIAAAFEAFDRDSDVRAVLLAAQGRAFCAGANFSDGSGHEIDGPDRQSYGQCPAGEVHHHAVHEEFGR